MASEISERIAKVRAVCESKYGANDTHLKFFLQELRADNIALVDAGEGWQPIETAPRDGFKILIYADCEVIESYWIADCDCWARAGASELGQPEPTHWQPLPAAPGEQIETHQLLGEKHQSKAPVMLCPDPAAYDRGECCGKCPELFVAPGEQS